MLAKKQTSCLVLAGVVLLDLQCLTYWKGLRTFASISIMSSSCSNESLEGSTLLEGKFLWMFVLWPLGGIFASRRACLGWGYDVQWESVDYHTIDLFSVLDMYQECYFGGAEPKTYTRRFLKPKRLNFPTRWDIHIIYSSMWSQSACASNHADFFYCGHVVVSTSRYNEWV